MLNIKERNANTVQPPEADTVILFLDAADSKLKLKDSSGDISEVSTNVIGIPDGGATGEVLAKASATDGDVEWVDPTGGVKEYVAGLTQTGINAPVATVLKNTLGAPIVYSYGIPGGYIGTLIGAFPLGKTIITVDSGFTVTNTDDDTIEIVVAGGDDSLDALYNLFKIEVYP